MYTSFPFLFNHMDNVSVNFTENNGKLCSDSNDYIIKHITDDIKNELKGCLESAVIKEVNSSAQKMQKTWQKSGDLSDKYNLTIKKNDNIFSIHELVLNRKQCSIEQQLKNVIDHPKQGIPEEDIRKILQFVEKENIIVGFRPVEPLAKTLLEDKYPTKPFNLKGKSSSWGPMAGFVPTNQGFSKLEKTPDLIEKFEKQIKDTLGKEMFDAVDLIINQKRYDELARNQLISVVDISDDKIKLASVGPSGKTYHFFAKKIMDGYAIFDVEEQPIQVLASKVVKRPIVADYDLLFVSPSVGDVDGRDNIPIKDVKHSIFKSKILNKEKINLRLAEYYNDSEKFYSPADKEFGNASLRVKNVVKNINKALGRTSGLEVVHHLADESNPTSDYKTNYPATIFFPRAMPGIDQVCMIHNKQEFAQVVQIALDNGYHVMRNPLWEKEIVETRRTRFIEAKQALEVHFQSILGKTNGRL